MNKILISKMYSGEFIEKELGHECINFVKADNGRHYVFVNSHGVVAVEHYEHTVSAILLVKRIDKYTVSILAKVTPKVLDEDMLEFLRCKDREQQKTKIKKYIADNGIAYAGVSLNDMFDDKDAECSFSPISYEAEQMYLPKNELYLTKDKTHKDKENYIYFSEGTIESISSHWFYCEKDETADAFSAITKYLNDEKLWEKFTPPALEVEDTPYFISILRKEYDEICYSNMFKHFFCIDRNVFKEFAKEILKIDISTDYTVEREKYNMDLLIQDNRNIIVIENKINSGVNGRNPDPGNKQNETTQFESQFEKYQEKAEEIAKEKGLNKENTHLFIFFPDHNKSDWSEFTSKKWEQIKYSQIHKFYEENKIDCKYFEEFLYALKLHKGESSDFKSEIMHIRLMNMLKERRR